MFDLLGVHAWDAYVTMGTTYPVYALSLVVTLLFIVRLRLIWKRALIALDVRREQFSFHVSLLDTISPRSRCEFTEERFLFRRLAFKSPLMPRCVDFLMLGCILFPCSHFSIFRVAVSREV